MSIADARSTVWQWAKHYLLGAFIKSWNSSITAVDAFVGVAVGASVDPQAIQSPNWKMVIYVFGVKYCLSIIKYFAENPIPTTLESRIPHEAIAPRS